MQQLRPIRQEVVLIMHVIYSPWTLLGSSAAAKALSMSVPSFSLLYNGDYSKQVEIVFRFVCVKCVNMNHLLAFVLPSLPLSFAHSLFVSAKFYPRFLIYDFSMRLIIDFLIFYCSFFHFAVIQTKTVAFRFPYSVSVGALTND